MKEERNLKNEVKKKPKFCDKEKDRDKKEGVREMEEGKK